MEKTISAYILPLPSTNESNFKEGSTLFWTKTTESFGKLCKEFEEISSLFAKITTARFNPYKVTLLKEM